MKRDDPLASPTLARLYITQGHHARAARVLETVLAAEPFNGHALVLRRRLQGRRRAQVAVTKPDDRLEIRFDYPDDTDLELHVVVRIWGLKAGRCVTHPLRSYPCAAPDATLRVSVPPGPASASACLAALDHAGRLRILAVAEPLTW